MNTRKTIKSILTVAVVAMAVMVTSAKAEIILDGYLSWAASGGTNTFDASDSDKLVVVVSGEHNFNESASGQVNSVTYDGQPLIKAVDVNPKKIVDGGHGDTATDIWYLDNPGSYYTAGTILASVSGNGNNYVYTVIALSGTAEGVGATAAAAGSASVDLTTTSAGSMVISNIGMGGGGNTADVQNVDPNSPAGVIEISSPKAGSNWAGHVVARTVVTEPGLQKFSFNTAKTDVATIAAEFLLSMDDPNLPTVEVGDDWLSWSGAEVTLNPEVTNNDTQVPQRDLIHVWTAQPAAGVLFTEDGVNPDDPATPGVIVIVTKAADTGDATSVKLTLTVVLNGLEGEVVDDMKIDVYDNSCDAAVAVGTSAIFDVTDFNKDCVTDIVDLAEMAAAWLLDYSLTAPSEVP